MSRETQRIDVGLANLKALLSKMASIGTTLNEVESAASRITSQIDPIWIGGNRELMEKRLIRIAENANSLEKEIENRRNQLSESIQIYERTEGKNEAVVGSLSIDDVF